MRRYKDKFRTVMTLILSSLALLITATITIVCVCIKNNYKEKVKYPYDQECVISPIDLGEQTDDTFIVTVYYPDEEISYNFVSSLKELSKISDINYYVMLYNDENLEYLSALQLTNYTDYFVYHEGKPLYRSSGYKGAELLKVEIAGTIKYGIPDVDLNRTLTINEDTFQFTSAKLYDEENPNSFECELNFSGFCSDFDEPIIVKNEISNVDSSKTKYVVIVYTNDFNTEQQEIISTSFTFNKKYNLLTITSEQHSYKTIQIRIYETEEFNKLITGEEGAYQYFNYKTWQ